MKRLLCVALLLVVMAVPPTSAAPVAAPDAPLVSTTIVISQFQVAGGSAADEFIELHNVSTSNFDLNGHRVVYRSAAGTTDVAIANWTASTIIAPGGYYLVANVNYDGAATADQTYAGATGTLAGTSGGIAIRNGTLTTGTIVDSVGYGSATNAFVETATTTVPAANASKARKNNGCQDTDNNSSDFELISPSTPRNSDSVAVTCVADVSITKTDGVTSATPGGSVTYTIVASNAGPSNATGATVADTFPGTLTCTWTCTGAGGGACTAAGSGNINDDTVNLPSGGSVTYTASCTIAASATGSLANTATVSSSVPDPTPGNASVTDTDTLASPTPVPTLSEWGMLILVSLVAGYGAWALRRRALAG